jgi:hypothetical protein
MGIDKRSKKSVAKNPLKKMGSFEGERGTRLDPYYREKINVRDLPELVEEEDVIDLDDE